MLSRPALLATSHLVASTATLELSVVAGMTYLGELVVCDDVILL